MAIPLRQSEFVRQRIERFFLIVVLCYVALIARLVYLQALHGEYYRDKAAHMRSQRITLAGQRGAILDRDGRPLAVTTHSGVLVCDPTLVKDPAATAAALAGVLGAPASSLVDSLTPRVRGNGTPDRNVVVRTGLTPDMVDALRKLRETRAGAKALGGINVVDEVQRAYPSGKDAVHVVGFLVPGRDGKPAGAMGLEQSLNPVLRGQDGYIKAEVDPHRRMIPDTQQKQVAPTDGDDVRLTIDSTVQHIAESELTACCQRYRPVGATAIVLDPKTGDVLALVNYPAFDPADRSGLKKSLEPMRNRALALFEPGSTMKIVTASAAIQDKVISPSTTFYCNGRLTIGKRTIRCVLHGENERNGHGSETVREIIEHSCNVGSAEIGMRLGMERMVKYLRQFGLLDQTGVGLPADTRGRLGFGEDAERGGEGKLARVAFGQSVMVTPLAMAAAYGAIANDGVLMQPRLIASYQNPAGVAVQQFPPRVVRRAVAPETAALMRSVLRDVVTAGTGKAAAVPGYTVAGKTGTAQKVSPGHRGYAGGKYVASFIGFLPATSPRAVVYVVVDEPEGGYYGAQVAAPVFKSIAEQLMWYWKVPPDDPASLSGTRMARH